MVYHLTYLPTYLHKTYVHIHIYLSIHVYILTYPSIYLSIHPSIHVYLHTPTQVIQNNVEIQHRILEEFPLLAAYDGFKQARGRRLSDEDVSMCISLLYSTLPAYSTLSTLPTLPLSLTSCMHIHTYPSYLSIHISDQGQLCYWYQDFIRSDWGCHD